MAKPRVRVFHVHEEEPGYALHEADSNGRCAIGLERGESGSGIDLRIISRGIVIGGWYDDMVGLEGGLVTWDQLDELRKSVRS